MHGAKVNVGMQFVAAYTIKYIWYYFPSNLHTRSSTNRVNISPNAKFNIFYGYITIHCRTGPTRNTVPDTIDCAYSHQQPNILTHCGRVKQIWVFNMVKLGTSESSPQCHSTRGNVFRGIAPSSTTRVFGEYFMKISVHKNSQ